MIAGAPLADWAWAMDSAGVFLGQGHACVLAALQLEAHGSAMPDGGGKKEVPNQIRLLRTFFELEARGWAMPAGGLEVVS
ncbi:hypothetical protein AK812_SmicGene38766 [Symbiodinium microadriaticum]|uniref:Uncharacterized protein n=1 Tax=Symbiodinium microadriaticum TaxID=2951 RepID=A0A1Q9CCW6_SYMMI|nr:hypothetical protein AK812_SmicGene38766 [Symbiodinium microadriaticum]